MTLAAARGMGTASSLNSRWHWLGSLGGRAYGETKFTRVTTDGVCLTGDNVYIVVMKTCISIKRFVVIKK